MESLYRKVYIKTEADFPKQKEPEGKTAEEIYYKHIDINDNALDRLRHIFEAMREYRKLPLREDENCTWFDECQGRNKCTKPYKR